MPTRRTSTSQGRKRRNFIPSLTVTGHVFADHAGMEQELHARFTAVFGTAMSSRTTINFEALRIQPIPLADLDVDIMADEVWNTIKELPPDRALGPDGFTGAFYRSSWPIVRDDIMAAVQAFMRGDTRGLERLNNALIILLLKKVGAASPGDLRPITMIHSFAKLVSKVLALRLAPKLDLLVDKNQNAFIQERTIQDNFKYT